MCSHRHVILHLHAKFRHNRTIGGEVMTSYRFFKMAAIESEIYFLFPVSWLDSFKKVEIYMHTEFRQDASIHGWVKTTSGLGKRTAAILQFYFRFRFRPTCSHRHVILYPCAKFRHNRKIGGRVMTSYRLFKMAAIKSEIYFQFRFRDWTRLRRWKSMCIPNFDEISQSTAELKLLPVSVNGRPPYWNFTSGFDFDLRVVIGMSFCTWVPNFVIIGRPAELWRHIHFSRWRPQSRKSTSGSGFVTGLV